MRILKLLLVCIFVAGFMKSQVLAGTAQGSFQIEIVAADMCCKGCVQKVAGQLYAAPGVKEVNANLKDRTVAITVSQKNGATLEQLWNAVAAGKGGPTQLTTNQATFTLTPADQITTNERLPATTSKIVIEDLNHEGRAQEIANRLYALPNVSKVSMDAQPNTLVLVSEQPISPWTYIGAVASTQSHPLSVTGSFGRFDIAWSIPRSANPNQQAQNSNRGGIQR